MKKSKTVKVRMVVVSQMLDILLDLEDDGVEYINLVCKITTGQDYIDVEEYRKKKPAEFPDLVPFTPIPPLPPGIEDKLTEEVLQGLLKAS